MAQVIEFETERLFVRQWRTTDRGPFAALNADPRVMAFYPTTLDAAASDAFADYCRFLIADRGWGFWAVETKRTAEFIGFVGLHVPSPDLPCSPCVEIGWRLACEHWGEGFATEAARGSLRVGFEELGLTEIVSFTSVRNLRSRAVMHRLGMLDTGETFDHPRVPEECSLRKHCLYRLTHERWASFRG